MRTVKPIEFFAAFFPEPVRPGQLMLCSEIRRSGKTHTDWCYNLRHAGRLVEQYRRTRDLRFGVALQDRQQALARARERWKRATPARVRGTAGSVTAVPALWAEVGVAGPSASGRGAEAALPPDRDAALTLFASASRPPSILVWTGDGFEAYWLLDELWLLETDDDRRRIQVLLRKLQWSLAAPAAAAGWRLDHTGDLGRQMRVPGTLNPGSARPGGVQIEQFPGVGERHRRYAAGDFELLADPPADDQGPERPWDADVGDGGVADLRPVWRGCSWLRHCYRDQAVLPAPEWRAALAIAGRAAAPGADGAVLARRFSERHPGYTPEATRDELARVLGPRSAPPSCRRVAEALGAWDRHCSRCPHHGRIAGPIDLGRADDAAAPAATADAPASGKGESEEVPPGPDPAAGASPTPVAVLSLPGGLRLEAVLRAPGGRPARMAAEGLAAFLGGLGVQPAAEPPPAGNDAGTGAGGRAQAAFLEGLEELLATLGGEATARQMVRALAGAGNRKRFALLRSALRQLDPGLRGGLPTCRGLSQRLRWQAGRNAGGRQIVRNGHTAEGVAWAVRRTPEPRTERR